MTARTHRPKRVLMTADTIGGVWTYSVELARALQAHGVDIVLATMGRELSGAQRSQLATLRNVQLHESTFRLEWMESPWDDVSAAGDWLLNLEQQTRPDVIHLNGFAHGHLSWAAPVLVVGHSCVLSWWQAVHGCDAPAEWDRYRAAVTAGIQAAATVAAPSQTMLQALAHCYGPFRNGVLIHNGRGASPGKKDKEPLIFCAGRLWDEAKNISALAKISSHLSWPVYVAGEDREGPRAEGDSLTRVGQCSESEMGHWFQKASIYALPARYEPFGLSILEAAQAGCALVLGDIPSLRELWGDAALFVDPQDATALRDCIEQLIRRPDLLSSARSRAAERSRIFSLERMAGAYLQVYTNLVADSTNAAIADRQSDQGETVKQHARPLILS